MESCIDNICSLEQELAQKASDLERQHKVREQQLVQLTLQRIADDVTSKESEILQAMSEKGAKLQAVREVVMKEIVRAANELLWCPEYVEKLGSEQHVMVFTGSHWEPVEPQQWKDFVSLCAELCGVAESMCMNHAFMNQLYEGTAFVLMKYRRQQIPDDEVWLNLKNGTLVMRGDGSVTLRDHNKDDLFTYTLNYAYNPDADPELWQAFLDRVLPDKADQLVLAEFIGYCLMKDQRFEKMLWLYGEGLNGKSVTLEVVEALLGSMNVSYLSLSDLTNDDVKRAGIEHKMLNISHESGKDVNPNVLKQLTSGERVTMKHLYRDPYETNDYGKFVAAFNQLPRAENTFGFFRRLIILPYEVTIPKEEIDRQLSSKLKAEVSGVLNWVLKSLPRLMNDGEFTASENCEKALERYRIQSDNVRLFANEMCEKCDYSTIASEVYTAYRNYCLGASLKPIGKNKFYDRMEAIGFERVTYGNVVYFKLKVKAE